jgi:hypothetical protein
VSLSLALIYIYRKEFKGTQNSGLRRCLLYCVGVEVATATEDEGTLDKRKTEVLVEQVGVSQ